MVVIVDKQKLNELQRLEKEKDKKFYAFLIACLFSLSLIAFWMLLEYAETGQIVPNKVEDIIMIPVTISFYFNGKQIVEKYFK